MQKNLEFSKNVNFFFGILHIFKNVRDPFILHQWLAKKTGNRLDSFHFATNDFCACNDFPSSCVM